MTTMITEVYDALLSAGAEDGKARRAAEVMAGHEDRFDRLEHRIDAVETRLNHKIDAVEAKLGQRIDAVEAKLVQRIDAAEAKLDKRIDGVEAKLEVSVSGLAGRLNLLQWQVGLLIGGVVTILIKMFIH